jgi:hypothetical protein
MRRSFRIRNECCGNALRIETVMAEKDPVFARKHSGDEQFGYIAEFDEPAARARFVKEVAMKSGSGSLEGV